jgi:molybdate transport repressor ModE-like protein
MFGRVFKIKVCLKTYHLNSLEVKSYLNEVIDSFKSLDDLRIVDKLYLFGKTSRLGMDEESAGLLSAIKKFGSISLASRYVGKDYRTAWTKIDELEKSFGFKVIDRTFGGLGGGSAKLTLKGEILLQKYLLAMKKMGNFIDSISKIRPDLSLMGSHCNALEILVGMMESEIKNFFVEYINVGSENGVKLVIAGIADISGVHLFDKISGEYNKFLLKDPKFGRKIALIRGYSRIQGIILGEGNPKNINSLEDVLRRDVVFINRNAGSGTRILFDTLMNKIVLGRGTSYRKISEGIRGYDNEVRSHFEVGTAVKYGKADMGIGIKSVAKLLKLDFIPIQSERFDFVLLKDKVDGDNIKKFLQMLSSKAFREEIYEMDLGIEFDDMVGKIISS